VLKPPSDIFLAQPPFIKAPNIQKPCGRPAFAYIFSRFGTVGGDGIGPYITKEAKRVLGGLSTRQMESGGY
jgi:hypothetical protein